MRNMAIIADDLTGASDSGVQFARKGFKTQVVFAPDNLLSNSEGTDTVVIDTDSRAIPAPEAYERVKIAARSVKGAGFSNVYKKLDSTLRGNLGAELDAVMDEIPFTFAVVAPAYPTIGRTTRNGFHYLNGVQIDQTEISNDPKAPVRDADIVKLLSQQSRRKAGLVSLEVIRQGTSGIYKRIEELLQDNTELLVFDAEQNRDMQLIADAVANQKWKVLWAGSAGLADYLPEKLGMANKSAAAVDVFVNGKPVMLVAGSLSKVTREQVENVKSYHNVAAIEMNPLLIIADQQDQVAEAQRCTAEINTALAQGLDVAFFSGSSPEQVSMAKELGMQRNMDGTEVANKIAETLGQITARVMEKYQIGGVILTGGDTAKAVCKHLGVTAIELKSELEPGVPISRLVGGQGLPAVTKAGAFGTKGTLLQALRTLKGEIDHV